ncbi:MAG: hypothetical protein H0W89_03625 [Candidatus Levybacteria bacterium]|nr:hypothetical protein [Candidatus Levybacteria bacterium]
MSETPFPEPKTLKERKSIIASAAEGTRTVQNEEIDGKKYHWEETPLLTHIRNREQLTTSDKIFGTFDATFRDVIPEEYSDIKQYIESVLAPKKGQAIGIELRGTASRLFGEFSPGFFQRTLGVNLTDYRDRIDPLLEAQDVSRNHHVLVGNIVSDETKMKVQEEFLHGQKADIIFERMIAGHSNLPKEPDFLGKQIGFWYEHLSENGVMFLTPPTALWDFIPGWLDIINTQYTDQIEAQYSDDTTEVLRIRKLPGAPEHLPLIDNRNLLREKKSQVLTRRNNTIDAKK